MVDRDSVDELSSQVTSRATRAGLWMTVGAAVLFLSGLFAGLALSGRLMGQPVSPAPIASNPIAADPMPPPESPNTGCEPRRPDWLGKDLEPGSPEMLDAVARRVREILKLDAKQEKRVRSIIDKYHPRMEELRREFEPELRKLAVEALADLWPVLQDEQREHLGRILGRHGQWLIRSVTQPASAATSRAVPSE